MTIFQSGYLNNGTQPGKSVSTPVNNAYVDNFFI